MKYSVRNDLIRDDEPVGVEIESGIADIESRPEGEYVVIASEFGVSRKGSRRNQISASSTV